MLSEALAERSEARRVGEAAAGERAEAWGREDRDLERTAVVYRARDSRGCGVVPRGIPRIGRERVGPGEDRVRIPAQREGGGRVLGAEVYAVELELNPRDSDVVRGARGDVHHSGYDRAGCWREDRDLGRAAVDHRDRDSRGYGVVPRGIPRIGRERVGPGEDRVRIPAQREGGG